MDPGFLAGLIAASGTGSVVDLTFPDIRLSCHLSSYVSAHTAKLSLDDEAYAFMQRFRSSGGRLPIINLAARDGAFDLRQLQGTVPPDTLIHAGVPPRTLDFARNLLEWAKTGPVVIVGDLSFIMRCQPILGTPALGILTVQITRGTVPTTLHYLLPPALLERTGNLVVTAMRRDLILTDDSLYRDSFRGVEDVTRVAQFTGNRLQSDGGGELAMRWTADSLIHDGGRQSESDNGYSWLWIDAERHLRILLGTLPQRQVTASVVFTRVVSPANMDGSQLIYNGRPLQTVVELWSGETGKFVANFFPEPGDLNVLGIAMPESARLDRDGPLLAGCIDSVEIA